MEALIGITGKDYVIMAADRRLARSIVVMKGVETKFKDLGPSLTMAYSGEPGDASTFAEYVQGNIKLYEMRNEIPLSTHAAAHFTRHLLADSLRSRVFLSHLLLFRLFFLYYYWFRHRIKRIC